MKTTSPATTSKKATSPAKTVKPAKASAPVAKVAVKTESNIQNLLDALQVRIDNAPNANQAESFTTEKNAFSRFASAFGRVSQEYQIDLNALAKRIATTDQKSDHFIAIYAITKVRQATTALATTSKTGFDGYTNAILFNLSRLQNLSNKEARMTMTTAIEYDELEQVQAIRRTKECKESTARTQASSSRMMLSVLGICNISKRKQNDVISFSDSATANAVLSMYQQ